AHRGGLRALGAGREPAAEAAQAAREDDEAGVEGRVSARARRDDAGAGRADRAVRPVDASARARDAGAAAGFTLLRRNAVKSRASLSGPTAALGFLEVDEDPGFEAYGHDTSVARRSDEASLLSHRRDGPPQPTRRPVHRAPRLLQSDRHGR